MTEPRNLLDLPADLPVPIDDGACDHLPAMRLPSLPLPATDGRSVSLARCSYPDRRVPTVSEAIASPTIVWYTWSRCSSMDPGPDRGKA